MKVLTVWQPWASLIAIEAKPFEFRGRKPPPAYVGRRIGINAGTRPLNLTELRALIARLNSARAWESCLVAEKALPLLRGALEGRVHLPSGAIVCTVELGEPRDGYDIAAEFGMQAELRPNDSDRDEHANFGWPMLGVEAVIPPEPHRGMQGWSEWTPMGASDTHRERAVGTGSPKRLGEAQSVGQE